MARPMVDWQEMYNALAAYRKKHGDCMVPTNWRQNPQLGRWVAMQRSRIKIQGLLDEQIELLNKLGFDWEPGDSKWQEMFQRLLKYRATHGNFNVPISYQKDKELSSWVANQRTRRKTGCLPADRVKKLDEVGFTWSVYKVKAAKGGSQSQDSVLQQEDKETPAVEVVPFTAGNIEIPEKYRNQPIKKCGFSVRLQNSLTKAGITLLGELDGNRFETFKPKGYARTTQLELGSFLSTLMAGQFDPISSAQDVGEGNAQSASPENEVIEIPVEYQDLAIEDLWVDGLIKRKLERMRIHSLRDMHGRRFDAIANGKAGEATLRKWVGEINNDLYKVVPLDFTDAVVWLINHIEQVLASQDPDDVATVEARFRKDGDEPLILEDVAKQFGVTRQRIQQIEDKLISEIVKRAALQGRHAVDEISKACENTGFPLTIDKLGVTASNRGLTLKRKPRFYALILHLAYPSLPIWIRMPNMRMESSVDSRAITDVLVRMLETALGKAPWRTSYFSCVKEIPALNLNDFVRAVIRCDEICIDPTPEGDWLICLRKIDVLRGVRAILEAADEPLTTREITQRGKMRYGDQWDERDDRGLDNKLMNDADDIYKLESGRWGLVRHIKTPPDLWPILQERFACAIRNAGHTVTTAEFLKNEGKEFSGKTDAYELMAILRLDGRFIKTGRKFMVGLKNADSISSGASKVPKVTDVLLRVLGRHSAALSATELKRLAQKEHSFSSTSFDAAIKKLKDGGLIRQTSTGVYKGIPS